ncbi:MAG: histone deacetylase family protein [Planctomycetes bacterium]|nr:histone deacetylase family protein [Planctomycetota bacterium]
MIRIVRIYHHLLPIEQDRIAQVQEIFRQNFSAVADYADKIPSLLDNPIQYGYTTGLLVSETSLGHVTGFSLVLYFPTIRSALLDFMAVRRGIRGGGTGSALYEATREYSKQAGALGLYLEALPDDPTVVTDPAELKENQRRLRFYENYDVRPIIGTEYETPIDDSPAPYLLYDGLDRDEPLSRSQCRAAIRTILTKKYSHLVRPDYIERVVESVVDDPVRLRPPKYVKAETPPVYSLADRRLEKPFVMVSCEAHQVHHVHERGYVERPARVGVIRQSLEAMGLFEVSGVKHFGQEYITAVHDADFVNYLKAVCLKLHGKRPVYPYVFPIRRPERRPKDLAVRAGYYCIDTFTPLDRNAYDAAKAAVDVALTAAEQVLHGCQLAYALCRPPGHHAERRVFGGFCYFNNAAIAAQFLSKHGSVAMLDIDFHHGNGAQDIFYTRRDVLTVSIHGHPNFAYPYFSGFADETGQGDGKGFNHNYPLAENAGATEYVTALDKALGNVRKFSPMFLVVCVGFDIMKGDPTGSFGLNGRMVKQIGQAIGALNLPTLVVQEGGYSLRNLRMGATALFQGFAEPLKPSAENASGLPRGEKKRPPNGRQT